MYEFENDQKIKRSSKKRINFQKQFIKKQQLKSKHLNVERKFRQLLNKNRKVSSLIALNNVNTTAILPVVYNTLTYKENYTMMNTKPNNKKNLPQANIVVGHDVNTVSIDTVSIDTVSIDTLLMVKTNGEINKEDKYKIDQQDAIIKDDIIRRTIDHSKIYTTTTASDNNYDHPEYELHSKKVDETKIINKIKNSEIYTYATVTDKDNALNEKENSNTTEWKTDPTNTETQKKARNSLIRQLLTIL